MATVTVSGTGTIPTPAAPAPPNVLDVELAEGIDAAGEVLTFQVVVTDNAQQTATATVTVTVQGKPTVTLAGPATVAAGTAFTLTATASSPGGSIESYVWSLQTATAPPVT